MQLSKSQKERLRVRLRFEELKLSFGNKCYFCNDISKLEFAHRKPTKLQGRGRGFIKRYYDIKNNKDSYILTCKKHNYLAENNFKGIAFIPTAIIIVSSLYNIVFI